MKTRFVALAWLAGVAACGGENGELPVASVLRGDAATNGQAAFAGARLAQPLAVTAETGDGLPVARASVRWKAADGSALVFSDSVTVTDGTGRAEVSVTLPDSAGAYAVRAELKGREDAAAVFGATALPRPVLSGVQPATFVGGDLVTVSGTALSDTLRLELGGAPATILDGTDTTLILAVPGCRVPGAVEIVARYPGGQSNTIAGTYQASQAPLALDVGEYATIDPASVAGCALLPAAGASDAEYLIAPQSTTTLPDVSLSYRLTGSAAVPGPGEEAPPTPSSGAAARFHDWLRAFEAEATRRPIPPQVPVAELAGPATIPIGDRRDFRVCNTVTCKPANAGDFTAVTATARYVGDHAALYLDIAAPTGGLTDQDFQDLGSTFETYLYDVATRAFGAESDIDRNDRVIILMTPVVNGMTPETDCNTQIITGFFFAFDIEPTSAGDPNSNQAEVFYALTPDPSGSEGCTVTGDQVRRLVGVTFVHELQHMISYNQHRLLRGGFSEVLWLNEALSHLSEELAALHFQSIGDSTRFSTYAIGDVYNAYLYLQEPSAYALLSLSGTGGIEERGVWWLFVRWLVDQFGDDVTRRLLETNQTGADNVAAVAGEPFDRLLPQWFLANYVSDLPGFTAPDRLRYSTWRFRTTYQSLNQQSPNRFPLPFPLVPTEYAGGTFDVNGTLRSGTGGYLRATQGAGTPGFTLQFTDPSGGPLGASGQPRLTVLRTR